MSDQTELLQESLYDKMKRLGCNMAPIDRILSKRSGHRDPDAPAHLFDSECCLLSIYLMQKNGRLYTVESSNGSPYKEVRTTDQRPARDTYICLHCRGQFATFDQAKKHYEGQNGKQS